MPSLPRGKQKTRKPPSCSKAERRKAQKKVPIENRPNTAQVEPINAVPSTSAGTEAIAQATTIEPRPTTGAIPKKPKQFREIAKKMKDSANGLIHSAAASHNTINNQNTIQAIRTELPIASNETMTNAIEPSTPSVNPPPAITREGGSSSGLITVVTTLIKSMCPNPLVHNILDGFVAAVDCYNGNPGPSALLDAINVFIGRFKSL